MYHWSLSLAWFRFCETKYWARGSEVQRAEAAARHQGRSTWGRKKNWASIPGVYRNFPQYLGFIGFFPDIPTHRGFIWFFSIPGVYLIFHQISGGLSQINLYMCTYIQYTTPPSHHFHTPTPNQPRDDTHIHTHRHTHTYTHTHTPSAQTQKHLYFLNNNFLNINKFFRHQNTLYVHHIFFRIDLLHLFFSELWVCQYGFMRVTWFTRELQLIVVCVAVCVCATVCAWHDPFVSCTELQYVLRRVAVCGYWFMRVTWSIRESQFNGELQWIAACVAVWVALCA